MAQKIKYKVKKGMSGLGLFALDQIKKEEKIIEYTGPLLSNQEADEKGGRYLFRVNSRWTIDGSGRENLARYINHACRPNAEALTVGKKVIVYAKKKIKLGEEISIHYGRSYFKDFIKPHGCRCPHCQNKEKTTS